jgi:PAS domain S-box-containing protein
MTHLHASAEEVRRLEALASYDILDSLPEADYDAITQIAAYICQTPIALISLQDADRQWFKSEHGLNMGQTSRAVSFCDHAIRVPDQIMEITNAHLDERFANNPFVIQAPYIVFYAGVPLVDSEGHALGALCVMDHTPRQLSAEQTKLLKALAQQVVTQLKLRRSQAQLATASVSLQTLNQDLKGSNQLLNTVVTTCPVEMVLWQAVRHKGIIVDFRSLFTNSPATFSAGAQGEALQENSLKEQFPGMVTAGFFDRLVTVVETNQPQQYQDRLNLTIPWGDLTLTPCGDGVLFTGQNITHLKKTEERLRAHRDDLNQLVTERTAEIYRLSALKHAILHHAGIAIVSADINGIIQTFNPAAERLLGYQAHELIGRKEVTFLHDAQHLQKLANQLSPQTGQLLPVDFSLLKLFADSQARDYVVLTKDGRHIPVLLTRTALRDEVGTITGYVGMATDITRQKESELALQQLLQREQELNKLKSQFVTTASHEFRTPLATIQSSVELVRLHLQRFSLDPQSPVYRHLGIIEKQVVNFSELLSDVLALEKIEAGGVTFNPQSCDLIALVHDVIHTHYSERKDGRQLQLVITGQPCLIKLDVQLMTHVLVNLLGNAFKFSSSNPELHITFDDHQVVARIIDTGIGIPAAEMSQLFNTFFRASNAVSIPGSGLGLVISRQFMALHGGQLQIASQEHAGTTSTLILPI